MDEVWYTEKWKEAFNVDIFAFKVTIQHIQYNLNPEKAIDESFLGNHSEFLKSKLRYTTETDRSITLMLSTSLLINKEKFITF